MITNNIQKTCNGTGLDNQGGIIPGSVTPVHSG